MKQVFFLSGLTALLAITAGCSGEMDENDINADGRVALQVTGGIRATSRAHDIVWDANDAIGIYMLNAGTTAIADDNANRHYLTDAAASGIFNSFDGSHTIYFPVGGEQMDFISYYPYQPSLTDGIYKIDVADQRSQKAIDLMVTPVAATGSKTVPAVSFRFVHKLVKLQLAIRADGNALSNDKLKGMTVKITNQSATACYNILIHEFSDIATERKAIPLLVDENGLSCEGIVLPAASTAGMALEFTLSDGSTMRWNISSAEKSQSFVAGNKYRYDIVLTGKGIEVTSSITDWNPGNGDGEPGIAE